MEEEKKNLKKFRIVYKTGIGKGFFDEEQIIEAESLPDAHLKFLNEEYRKVFDGFIYFPRRIKYIKQTE